MIAIYGCGGHARSVADVLIHNGVNEMIFIDKNAKKNEVIYKNPVLKFMPSDLLGPQFFLAIGDNAKRKEMYACLPNCNFCNVISRNAYLGSDCVIGSGNFIANYAYIGPDVHIGNHTIINTHAVVEHECEIGDFCHIAPNSIISGRSIIGNNVFLGAGVTVIDKINIASNILVGANSTVISDLTQNGVYVGSPAKKIK